MCRTTKTPQLYMALFLLFLKTTGTHTSLAPFRHVLSVFRQSMYTSTVHVKATHDVSLACFRRSSKPRVHRFGTIGAARFLPFRRTSQHLNIASNSAAVSTHLTTLPLPSPEAPTNHIYSPLLSRRMKYEVLYTHLSTRLEARSNICLSETNLKPHLYLHHENPAQRISLTQNRPTTLLQIQVDKLVFLFHYSWTTAI